MTDEGQQIIEVDAPIADGAQDSDAKQEPLTVEQVQDAVDKAVESYSDANSETQREIADATQALHDDIGVLSAKLDNVKATGGESGVVVIDASQWDTVARCWAA